VTPLDHETDPRPRSVQERVETIVASPRVAARGAPGQRAPGDRAPEDLALLYTVADGLELDDGTRILAAAEVERATAWLVEEKSLHWEDDLRVIGERDDLVLVLDRDARGARAGGGILEAATDGLEAFRRVALGVVEYLEVRLGLEPTPPIAPERAAREAIALRAPDPLEEAIERGFYPGADRDLAHAAMSLGAMRAASGDRLRALAAFERAAAAKARQAAAAENAGAPDVAAACRERSRLGP
jgi:hypothetical protein